MGRIYHRTPQKVNTFYHKLNIEELLDTFRDKSLIFIPPAKVYGKEVPHDSKTRYIWWKKDCP